MDERGGDDVIFVASLVDGAIVNDTSSVDVVFSDIGSGDVFVSNIVSDVSSVDVISSDPSIMTSLMVTTPCQMIHLRNPVEATKRTFLLTWTGLPPGGGEEGGGQRLALGLDSLTWEVVT